jgi:hypothetical protein
MIFSATLLNLALSGEAQAYVDPDCADVAAQGAPEGYSDEAQQNFLLNYFAMATTLSPLHGAIPNAPGRGSIGLELAAIPPLSCERRLVLNYTKTEDTNKAPVAPRPRMTFTFNELGPIVPYGGLAYVPPVKVFGTRNVIVSAEAGFGVPLKSGLQIGGRYHATLMKTVAEIATPFEEGETPYLDFYSGSTFGVDGIVSYKKENIIPYLAVGLTDASTFFYIGDDGVVSNNTDPFLGLTASLGGQFHLGEHVDLATEFYTAPGYIYTGRLRAAYAF